MPINSIFIVNIFLTISISLFAILYLDYRYLLSPRNLSILYFIGTNIFGYVLLPFSLIGVVINNADTQEVFFAMNTSLYINLLAFFSFLIGIFWFSRKKRNNHIFFETIKMEEFVFNKVVQIVLFIYIAIGSAVLIFVFNKTSTVPFLSANPLQVKYFQNLSSVYVKYRPFYTLGLNILSFTAIVSLFGLLSSPKGKKWLHLLTYTIFCLTSMGMLLLTMKRGYLLLPFVLIAGTKLIKRVELNWKKTLLFSSALVFAIVFLGIWLWQFSLYDNSSIEQSVEKLKLLEKERSLIRQISASSNNFFVPIRELGRFIIGYQNSIEYKGYFLGKTYIASLISFIPTEINPYKDKYHIGRVTLKVLGDNPDISGAPRIGFAGEAFYNFYVPGVIIIGFILGVATMWLNHWYLLLQKENIKNDFPYLVILFLFFQFYGMLESGSATLLFLMINLFFSIPLMWIFLKYRTP